MRALLGSGVLAAVLVSGSGCDGDADHLRDERYVALEYEWIEPTATGHASLVGLLERREDGTTVRDSSVTVTDLRCDTPECEVKGHDPILVRSARPGVVRVTGTATVGASTLPIDFAVPFRTPTKIVIRRQLDTSAAGSAFAMVPGDTQTWLVGLGDDEGPLAADAGGVVNDGSVECFRDTAGRGVVDRREGPALLRCKVGRSAPGTMHLDFEVSGFTRRETVHVVDLETVQSATLESCAVAGTYYYGFTATEMIPIEQAALPCEPVTTSVTLPGKGCPEARFLHVRLVTTDGTVAFGGAPLLRVGEVPFYPDMAGRAGEGRITGRFGPATIDLPYVVGPSCL